MLLHVASFQPRDTAYCIISNNSYTQIIRTPPISNKNIHKCKNEIIILAIRTGKVNGLLSWLMVGTIEPEEVEGLCLQYCAYNIHASIYRYAPGSTQRCAQSIESYAHGLTVSKMVCSR